MVKINYFLLKLIIPQPKGFCLILTLPVNSFWYYNKLFIVFLRKEEGIVWLGRKLASSQTWVQASLLLLTNCVISSNTLFKAPFSHLKKWE